MKFLPPVEYNQYDPESFLHHRRVSENGLVHFGLYRVLFGWRVRAGLTSKLCFYLDWCGGDNWDHVCLLYSVCLNILEHREETENCFDGLPTASNVKPFFMDFEFMYLLNTLVEKDFTVVKLQNPE